MSAGGDGKHGGPGERPRAFKQVRGPKGGRLNRGGPPGGYDPVAHQLGMMKREGRRVLSGWMKRLERIGDTQLTAAEAEVLDPAKVLAHLRACDLPVRIIAQIAEATRAEDARDDPSAPDAPTIIVETSGPAVRIPLPGESNARVPSADPSLPVEGKGPELRGTGPLEA